MAKTLAELTTLTRQKSNVEGNQVVTDAEIAVYINEAVKSLYDLIVSVDASYYMLNDDFTLTSTASGSSHPLPAAFYKMRGLVIFPDTERETPVFLRSFAERTRSSWGYTLDGDSIRVWPWQNAGQGPWRLYYIPKAPQFAASHTVRIATTANLNVTPSGGPGPGRTLIEVGNGALVVDGVAAVLQDRLLVKNQTAASDNGIYVVSNAGSVGTQYILVRASDYDTNSDMSRLDIIGVTAGAVNAGTLWRNASATINVDVSPLTFATPTLDVTLDNFDEYVTNKAALMVFAKRQMSPGVVPALFSAAEERVKGMASMRASEPEQAPIMWAPGRRGSWYDDDDVV